MKITSKSKIKQKHSELIDKLLHNKYTDFYKFRDDLISLLNPMKIDENELVIDDKLKILLRRRGKICIFILRYKENSNFEAEFCSLKNKSFYDSVSEEIKFHSQWESSKRFNDDVTIPFFKKYFRIDLSDENK